MRRTDRLFEIIQLFRGGRLWRGQDLAERLGVSLRTVYRDIDTLIASGVPIEGERGVGYLLREPVFLPPLTLTHAELEALQLGARLVARLGDPSLVKAAEALLGKVDAVVPSDRQGVDLVAGVGLYGPSPEGEAAYLPVLREAIRRLRRLTLVYRRLDGVLTERLVRPLHLEHWGRVWTLSAWCELRGDFRVFRVDLIEAVEVGEAFLEEPGKSFLDFLARKFGEAGELGAPSNSI